MKRIICYFIGHPWGAWTRWTYAEPLPFHRNRKCQRCGIGQIETRADHPVMMIWAAPPTKPSYCSICEEDGVEHPGFCDEDGSLSKGD